MPVGHIETAPRGEREPKARFVALRVDELSAAAGPANERDVLVLKDTTESAMSEATEQSTVETTTKEGEGSTPAAPIGEPDPVVTLTAQVTALTAQVAALQSKLAPAAEVVPAAKEEPKEEAKSVVESTPERKTAEIQLVKKSVEGKAPVVAVAKSTDGLQPDFLQRVTAALTPLMQSIESISIGMCWMDEDIVNISFSGEPVMTTTATAKDTAAPAATTEQTVTIADVAKDVKDLVESVKALSGRVETIEKRRGVTSAVTKEGGEATTAAPSESLFKGAV